MRATAIEFRLRMAINLAIIVLGFWAPWIDAWGIGKRAPLAEWLALELSRAGILRFTVAAAVMNVLAAALAGAGAILRVWASACLGPGTVQNLSMRADSITADGPFRYVRNPLYLGLWFMVAALAFLMPSSGALAALTLVSVFLLRLTLGEEEFLAAKLGEPYVAYLRAVPRLIPRTHAGMPAGETRPRWLAALLSELTPIGIFFAFAVLSWNYDLKLMVRAVLISFGASLVVRALMPGINQAADSKA